jgi:hypothetical protein
MVEGYKDRRYFRRGNYRAVKMPEVEVEAAYASPRSLRVQAEDFFRTADFGEIPVTGQLLRVIIFPVLTLVARETMREREFIEWLRKNPPENRRGDWVPFLDGAFDVLRHCCFNGLQFGVRLFHNGAFSFTGDMDLLLSQSEALNLKHAEKVVKLYALASASKAIELLRIASPLAVKVEIHGSRGLKALDPREVGYSNPLTAGFALPLNLTSFTEESSSDELLGKPEQVLSRLVARFTEALGSGQNTASSLFACHSTRCSIAAHWRS